jgi:superfamily I DNA and/or RNA helicase
VGATADRLLQNCRIVVTTIQRAHLDRRVAARRYDVLLVDEAGMCSLADVFAAASLVATHVSVFGDGRQLPAVVTATTDAARQWLGRDVFQAHHLHERILGGEAVPGAGMLTQQRRMAPPIARIISEGWYDGRLTSDPILRRRRGPFSDTRSTVTLIDTSALHPQTVLAGRERTNPVHAEVIGALLDELIEAAKPSPGADAAPRIAVLTPYCGQVDVLHQLVRRRRLRHFVHMSTVHGAQGDEHDAVILDLTDAPGSRLSPFLRARRFEDVGARLLNVAISRARHRLYVVADVAFLRARAPRDGAVRMLLALIEQHGAVEGAAGLMRNRPHRRIAS